MKVKFYKTIFLFLIFCSFFFVQPFGQKVYAAEKFTIEFCYDDYSLVKSEEELGFSANKFGLNARGLAIKVFNMGFDYKSVLRYIYPNIDGVINEICENINLEPVSSVIDVKSGRPIITEEEYGQRVDEDTLYRELFFKLVSSEGNEICVEIETIELLPIRTRKDNSLLANEKSSFITYINGTNQEGRINNIKRALSMFNGMEIKPGEVISFNDIIGDTTLENGYSLAKVILNGKFTDDYGGGVCQAATTLYNAALVAGLEILEANPHSLKVGYVKGSFDAMVSAGVSDLKIKNPYNSSIYIYTYATNLECGVKIFGEPNEFEIVRRSDRLDVDETVQPKIAYKSEGFLDYYKDGKLLKTEKIRKDSYYKVKKDEAASVENITPAV